MRRVKKTHQKDEKLFSMNLNEIKNHDGKSFSSGKKIVKKLRGIWKKHWHFVIEE